MDEPKLTPGTAVREAAERVRVAYDELQEVVRLAHAVSGDEPRRDVLRHYLGEIRKKTTALGKAVAELERLVARPTARRIEGARDPER
jgi:hypothetical protein